MDGEAESFERGHHVARVVAEERAAERAVAAGERREQQRAVRQALRAGQHGRSANRPRQRSNLQRRPAAARHERGSLRRVRARRDRVSAASSAAASSRAIESRSRSSSSRNSSIARSTSAVVEKDVAPQLRGARRDARRVAQAAAGSPAGHDLRRGPIRWRPPTRRRRRAAGGSPTRAGDRDRAAGIISTRVPTPSQSARARPRAVLSVRGGRQDAQLALEQVGERVGGAGVLAAGDGMAADERRRRPNHGLEGRDHARLDAADVGDHGPRPRVRQEVHGDRRQRRTGTASTMRSASRAASAGVKL